MKTLISSVIFSFIIVLTSCGGDKQSAEKTVTFKVNGVCDMCKRTMEKPLTPEVGVSARDWNVETKVMELTYDTSKISINEIYNLIAETGYEPENIPANQEAYDQLHECCKYKDQE